MSMAHVGQIQAPVTSFMKLTKQAFQMAVEVRRVEV